MVAFACDPSTQEVVGKRIMIQGHLEQKQETYLKNV
jgi:hypothetical protein